MFSVAMKFDQITYIYTISPASCMEILCLTGCCDPNCSDHLGSLMDAHHDHPRSSAIIQKFDNEVDTGRIKNNKLKDG